MITISVHENAQRDLAQLLHIDKKAVAAVLTTLEQVKADPQVLDKLTTHGVNHLGSARVNVKPWRAMQSKANLWRIRILDTPATCYRVVYGYHWQTKQICVFAVVHKEKFDYDDLNSDLSRRIQEDWESL
jgi:mRNA-degrading endonuclease RelE of RelBE toxin-antitoxin system